MKHEHKWKPAAMRYARVENVGDCTIVLHKCVCGDISHSQIPGRFEEHEIMGGVSKRDADRMFLRGVGIKA